MLAIDWNRIGCISMAGSGVLSFTKGKIHSTMTDTTTSKIGRYTKKLCCYLYNYYRWFILQVDWKLGDSLRDKS